MVRTYAPNPPDVGGYCGLAYMLGSAVGSAPLDCHRLGASKWLIAYSQRKGGMDSKLCTVRVSPTPHNPIMSSSAESIAIVPDHDAAKPALHEDDARLVRRAEVQLLHEATLQDLIRNRNYAIKHLLYEHNELLKEWLSLGGTPIEYSEVDFLTPPKPTQPYMIFPEGIAEIHVTRPSGGRYPPDCRQFSKGTQTDDLDDEITLMDIDPSAIPIDAKDCEKK
ncbi:hypothetical protein EI94DRAFT_1904846 [Lactarius quietus]|nr:hypothetical protein EI94DRAFT_1904846 [Lactarius quietus]